MATTIRAFNIGLYEEHLEEISFLYEQRIALLKNTEMGWRDLAPFEARLEAHMDALLVGRELALEVCQRLTKEGDFGQLFAAVSVFCRQRQAPLLAEVLRTMDFADPQKVTAVADALKFELPEEWSTFIAQALARREAWLVAMLATVTGYRRLASSADLIDSLAQKPPEAQQLIEAIGRLRAIEAEDVLADYLLDANSKFRNAALLALLRIGAVAPLPSVEVIVAQANLSMAIVALGAGRTTASALLQLLQAGEADSSCLLALGLLGDPATLRAIYSCLDAPELAESAAQALYWITGASMDEEVFVPEEVDEQVLFKNELQVWQQYKEAPKRVDGLPYGETSKKLSVDKEAWKRWFEENAAKFEPKMRYRCGKPYSPASLLRDLAAEQSSTPLRRFTALELEIRYGCDVVFEIDMTVGAQIDAMRKMAGWVNAQGDRFQPGQWYFNAQLLS